ncbi:MAG: tetratricopeptide repeat protein [Sphingobacteriaceae bacterium]
MDQAIFVEALPDGNALIYLPKGYERVIHEKSVNTPMYSGPMEEAYEKWRNQRVALNPEMVFLDGLNFKKGNIFLGYNLSWITLSSFFKYQSSGTVENQRAFHKRNFINSPKRFGLENTYTLLLDVHQKALSLINADSVFIYNSNETYKYKSDKVNYGSIVVNLLKFDLARIRLVYYYPLGEEQKVFQEIANTWGMVQFKPDRAFTLPDRSGRVPKQLEPELYMGKFAIVNNPEQFKRDSLNFEKKKTNRKVDSLLRAGIALFSAKKLDEAKKTWQEAIATDPRNPFPYAQMTFASIESNQRDSATFYWENYKERSDDGFSVSFLKAQLLKRFGDLKAAAEIYEKLVADSLHLDTYAELGGIYGQLGQYEKAVKVFDDGLAMADTELAKAKQAKPHRRIYSAKLAQYKLSYALLAQKNEQLQQSREMLLSVIEEYGPDQTGSAGLQLTGTYGQVPKSLLAECHFVLGTLYGKSHDGVNARFHLNKSAELGKQLPAQFENFMKAEGN